MSKRFGRNQKRRMQHEIDCLTNHQENLQRSIYMADGLAREIRRELDDTRRTIRQVAYVLGETFIGLPVKSTHIERLMDRYRIAKHDAMHSFERAISEPRIAMEMTHVMTEALQGNRLEFARDQLRNMTHMRYVTPRGEWEYAISEDAWRTAPSKELELLLIKDIAEQMAHALIAKARG